MSIVNCVKWLFSDGSAGGCGQMQQLGWAGHGQRISGKRIDDANPGHDFTRIHMFAEQHAATRQLGAGLGINQHIRVDETSCSHLVSARWLHHD